MQRIPGKKHPVRATAARKLAALDAALRVGGQALRAQTFPRASERIRAGIWQRIAGTNQK